MYSRRLMLAGLAAAPAAKLLVSAAPAMAEPLSANPFAGKKDMIQRRALPPLLETPLSVFDEHLITPTDRFFVRWHYMFPTEIDTKDHRLAITGHVEAPVSLSLAALALLPQVEVTAVNQCAGNGRALFSPRVPGAQWGNGAIGNAVWRGVRVSDVLAKAKLRPGAKLIRASGEDIVPMEGAPPFEKSISLDHANSKDVILATHMNGEPLSIVHGAPLRLIVPGWFSTYWVKMLSGLEVLDQADENFWMAKAYQAPANPTATMKPGEADVPMIPVTAMVPRSFITNIEAGASLARGKTLPIRGIAMGGDTGVKSVEVSTDGGQNWQPATLGPDAGRYSFRRFEAAVPAPPSGAAILMSRVTAEDGRSQPLTPNWNGGGYLRNVTEPVPVTFL